MTRQEAKVYSQLPRNELGKINKGFERHYNVIREFADGKEVEIESSLSTWVGVERPVFSVNSNYRVKSAKEQTNEQEESVVKEDLTTEPTEKLVEALDGKPLTIREAYAVRQLRASAEPTNTHFLKLNKNEFEFILALRAMMKENRGAKN